MVDFRGIGVPGWLYDVVELLQESVFFFYPLSSSSHFPVRFTAVESMEMMFLVTCPFQVAG